MAVRMRSGACLTRRRFLIDSAAAAGAATFGAVCAPAISRASDRPVITHGVQSGDVSVHSGVVWARADRPARISFDIATSDTFRDPLRSVTLDALPESDFAVKALIDRLPAGQDLFYRARSADLSSLAATGEPVTGRFRTAPAERRPVSFVWSGDTCGGGFGIDESRGGMTIYETMRRLRPDFFIHCGDTIYADCPIAPQFTLADGSTWRNLVTEDKAKVAETLAEYRANYKYNLLDRNLRAFNAEVPMLVQWDDHEVTNDWSPSASLHDDPRYTVKSVPLLQARAARAFHEFLPISVTPQEAARVYRKVPYGPLLDVFFLDMRTYRGPNGGGAAGPAALLGAEQLAWLKRELAASHATWKVIAADMPLGVVAYGEAVAEGDGPPRGREHEFADLLGFIMHAGIANTVWLTADVHYTAAHRYDPNRAVFQDFLPFWEFVSGPLHAGTWAPGRLDNTFGPQLVYAKGAAPGQGDNLPPSLGLQFFGHVAIDGASGLMTVTLKDAAGSTLFRIELAPEPPRRPSLSQYLNPAVRL